MTTATEIVSNISSLVAPASIARVVWPSIQLAHPAAIPMPRPINRLTLRLSTPSLYTSSNAAVSVAHKPGSVLPNLFSSLTRSSLSSDWLSIIVISLRTLLFEKLLAENQDGKAKIAIKIEDQIFDFLEKQNDLLFIVESIGGIELKIVEVDQILIEINDEQKILEAITISTKNLAKSTLDIKKDMQKSIKNEIQEIIKAYKIKRAQITKTIISINEQLSSSLKKVDLI